MLLPMEPCESNSNEVEPKDAYIVKTILKDLGINKYEPGVIALVLDFCHTYNCLPMLDGWCLRDLNCMSRPVGSCGLKGVRSQQSFLAEDVLYQRPNQAVAALSIISFAEKGGYVTSVLEDARTFSEHAGRKAIRTDDVKLSVMMQLDKVFASPPPRDIMLDVARTKNCVPLPLLLENCSIRLPPDDYCTVPPHIDDLL